MRSVVPSCHRTPTQLATTALTAFLPADSVHRNRVFAATFFEMRSKVPFVVRFGFLLGDGNTKFRRRRRDHLHGDLEIVQDVGPKVKSTSRPQNPQDVLHACLIHNSPITVPLLPPRIGKVDMDGGERSVRDLLRQQGFRVPGDHDRIQRWRGLRARCFIFPRRRTRRRQSDRRRILIVQRRGQSLCRSDPSGRMSRVFVGDFDAQKIVFGIPDTSGCKKQPFPRADLEFQGPVIPKQRGTGNGLGQLIGRAKAWKPIDVLTGKPNGAAGHEVKR